LEHGHGQRSIRTRRGEIFAGSYGKTRPQGTNKKGAALKAGAARPAGLR
jgi:ribosomal small subunit protein bTHX